MTIEEIIHTYGDGLYRVAYIYTKDEQAAEEILQDVLMKFYQKQDQFEGRSELKTYLTKMVVNRSYDYLRSWKGRFARFEEKFLKNVDLDSLEKKVIEKEERQMILERVLELPIKYREVIIYYYYEEYTTLQIADMLYLPVSTVKSRLQRARTQLKTVLHVDVDTWEVLNNGRVE